MIALSSMPWWTEADAAELDALSYEFVRAAFVHRERCPDCASGEHQGWCSTLASAFDAVVDWRESRIRLSKAAWLRERQHDVEAMARPRTKEPVG